MSQAVFVANEPIEPTHHGGRVRMRGLVDGLRQHLALDVVELGAPDGFAAPASFARRLSQFTSLRPRLGAASLNGHDRSIEKVARRDGAVSLILSHSYLAPYFGRLSRTYIDFPNLEVDRLASFADARTGLHKASARFEAAKARLWEPKVARAAEACIACTERDAEVLRRWGARVLTVPHGTASEPLPLSDPDGYVLFVASAGYGPNDAAARWLVNDAWPWVRRTRPNSTLRIVGRGTDNYRELASDDVRIVGEVSDLRVEFAGSAVVVAPVVSGGGSQLKIAEALAHARVVVTTRHSLLSVPQSALGLAAVADEPVAFAEAIVDALDDVASRHAKERRLARKPIVPRWPDVVSPLARAILEEPR